ncbi:alpha/beta hydrolase [Siccationidurans soli]|uniref:Alpha/beta hydrolase n=1 Tax=Hymenobacter negativus TaxID=2795026 RepID=A0ABS3QM49_9BACT|nr:alpha/beta hydrolase [Hymenobacter negativus]
MPSLSSSPAIVFITGAVVTSASWDNWKTFFEGEGYTCYAPNWPHKEAPAAELRHQHPHSPIAQNGLEDVLQVYTDFIAQLSTKPIVIGHSFGGLIVQLLLQQNAVVAGVAIESAPPLGVVVANCRWFGPSCPCLACFHPWKPRFCPLSSSGSTPLPTACPWPTNGNTTGNWPRPNQKRPFAVP